MMKVKPVALLLQVQQWVTSAMAEQGSWYNAYCTNKHDNQR